MQQPKCISGSTADRRRRQSTAASISAFVFFLTLLAAIPAHASRTVIDETGHQVLVPDHPHRIICLTPSVTDAAFSIGLADDIIAVSDYSRYPQAATRKPTVGTSLTPSIERIVALHPDLILSMESLSARDTTEQLRRLHLAVFLVDTHGLAGILHTVESIGAATNHQAQAQHEVAELTARIAGVRAASAGRPAVTIFLPIWFDPLITIGRGAFMTELISAAGGRSVTADLAEEWPQISLETVIVRQPQALLLSRDGKLTPQFLATRPGWTSLPAMRDHRFFYYDDRMELASPVAIDALEDLARQLHG